MADPVPALSFGRTRHDRLAQRRDDLAWLARQSAAAAVLVVGDGTVAMAGDRLRLVSDTEAPPGERVLLGSLDGRTYVAVLADVVPPALDPQPVRAAASLLDGGQAGLLAHAAGLANWHRTHPRCARCGAVTDIVDAGHARRCPACDASHFPRTDPAVIMLVTDPQDRALLGRQPAWPESRYSTLAGFVEPGETLEDAVRREVAEEVGVPVQEVTYAGSQPWPFPSSLMVGFFATAPTCAIRVDGIEIVEAGWFTRAEVAELTAAGAITLPGLVSISRWLIESWLAETHVGSAVSRRAAP